MIALNLLDPVKGHAIQTWEFDDRFVVRIGRGDANDVVIGDPLVSRIHAELSLDASGVWRIVSMGRNGTWVDGERVSDGLSIRHGMIMQLGSNGPWVEFREDRHPFRSGETIMSCDRDPSALSMPQVDIEVTQAEVNRIADGESFKDLQKQAQELRRTREKRDLG